MRFAMLLVLLATPVWAGDAAPSPAPLRHACGIGVYLEPSLFYTYGWPRGSFSEPDDWRDRLASGALIRPCGHDVQFRIGATLQFSDNFGGFGGEGELVLPITMHLRGGVRASVESTASALEPLTTVGLRLHIEDTAFVEVDFYHFNKFSDQWPGISGLAFGVGLEGIPGAIAGGIEIVGLGVLAAMLSQANWE